MHVWTFCIVCSIEIKNMDHVLTTKVATKVEHITAISKSTTEIICRFGKLAE